MVELTREKLDELAETETARWVEKERKGIRAALLHFTWAILAEQEKTPALGFDDWLAYGVDNGFCSQQVCANHAGIPLSDDEMDIENPDFCIHVVRLGNEDDWQREIDGYNEGRAEA